MRRWLRVVVVGVLAIVWAPAAAGAPPGPTGNAAEAAHGEPTRTVTLVTGDRVVLGRSGDTETFSFVPAQGRPARGYVASRIDGRLRVVPRDVLTLVPDVLDPALFEIDTLLAEQGDDRTAGDVRVISQQGPGTARTALTEASGERRPLASIGGESVAVPKSEADEFGAALVAARPDARSQPGKIWLDRRLHGTLDANLVQVGAPALWDVGGDGAGTTIAVLDTGVDATHPDLVGKVVASRNFTAWPDDRDHVGHGTHVAAIAAGSGAASGGLRRGVAHAADVLNAKVLGDDNLGLMSDIILGVEWAAEQGADVANLSIGSDVNSDGTDPLSQAIDSTTRSSDTFFVVAAGNRAEPRTIGSPAAAADALTVGAVDSGDVLASFSSRGPRDGGGIKPEITAPGVEILSAFSSDAGGTPDQRYVPMSGTSMAAPHVAGAAAVLAQRHPEWTPHQLRAALVSTAQHNPAHTVYDQGAGRLWLPGADAATVLPETHAVDFGLFRYPQDGVTVSREVSWRNVGPDPVTVDVSVQAALPDGTVTVSPSTLTIEPGEVGTASVRLRPGGGDDGPAAGTHGGRLVAVVRGPGEVTSSIPFAFDNEPERYDLRLEVLDRAGEPAVFSSVAVLNVDDLSVYSATGLTVDENGTAAVRVPPGNYHAEALVGAFDADDGSTETRRVVLPDVQVRGPTSATLDARQSAQAELAVARRTTVQAHVQQQERRTDALGNSADLLVGGFGPLDTIGATPTEPARVGTLDTYLSGRVTAPQVRFARIAGDPPLGVFGTPAFVGERRLRVVDVGAGTAQDVAAAPVRDAIAVVTSRGHPPTATVVAAERAGAALVVLANSSDRPWQTFVEADASTPALTVTSSVGAALVAAGTIRVAGAALVDPVYDVVYPSPGRFPDSNHHLLSPADVRRMARVRTAVAAVPSSSSAVYGLGRGPVVEGFDVTPAVLLAEHPGARRTEFVMAATWLSSAYRNDGASFVTLDGQIREETAATRRRETWFGAPWRPLSRQVTTFGTSPAAFRDRESLFLGLPPLADADGHVESSASFGSVSSTYSVYADDRLLGTSSGPFGIVGVPADVGRLRLRYDVDARGVLPSQGRSRTEWRLGSTPPAEGSAEVPLLEVDLRLPVGLDDVLDRDTAQVRVTRPFGAPVDLRRVTVQVSTDGGTTWQRADVALRDPTTARLALPPLPQGSPVTVQVHATDRNGDSVAQILYDAATAG